MGIPMKQLIKKYVKRGLVGFFKLFGYDLERFTTVSALKREKARNSAEINTVIDVGASDGHWAESAQKVFPRAFYHLIEANQCHAAGLARFKARHPNSDYVISAAGNMVGQLYFEASDPFSGCASLTNTSENLITVPSTTIDAEVKKNNLRPPFLIKLDTHGFEVPILEGALQTLKETQLIVIEVYNFKLRPGCLMFHEMCQYMEALGFRCIDIAEQLNRPGDGVFWQIDMVFAKSSRQEFASNSYHPMNTPTSSSPE